MVETCLEGSGRPTGLVSGRGRLWPCSSLAMLVSGHARLWPCSSLAMLVSGHARLWAKALAGEVAPSRGSALDPARRLATPVPHGRPTGLVSGRGRLWPCSSLAMLVFGHARLWACSSLGMLVFGRRRLRARSLLRGALLWTQPVDWLRPYRMGGRHCPKKSQCDEGLCPRRTGGLVQFPGLDRSFPAREHLRGVLPGFSRVQAPHSRITPGP
jgi:hypothetical protein